MAKLEKAEVKQLLREWTKRGLRPSRMFILGFVTVFVGYALWPRTPRKVVPASQTANPMDWIQTARIYPNPAYAHNTLEVRLEDRYWMLQDSLTYKWFINGRPVPNKAGNSLKSDLLRKGDEIFAEVRLIRDNNQEITYQTNATRVLNTPPRIISATTTLQQGSKPGITAVVQSLDADGDPVTYSYTWFKNETQLAGESGAVLDPWGFQRGDWIYARIVADDGQERSPSKKSAALIFENTPPRITSNPPALMTEDRHFVYQMTALDSDGDPLSFELAQSPAGMTISKSGRIDWALPPSEVGSRSFLVEVIVKDTSGGEAKQTFEIAVSGTKGDGEAGEAKEE